MSESKKFYWLKLKKDFFKRHDIRIIEEMPNGKDYVLFYLKLLLESIDHDGALRFSDTIPYNEQMLSVVTNTNIDIVRAAMKLLIELDMMEVLDNATLFMTEAAKMIGSASGTDDANRQRRCREKKKQEAIPENVTKCHTFVTDTVTKDNERKSIEIETETDKEKETEYSIFLSGENEREKREFLGGNLGRGLVMISDEEMEKLLEVLSLDEFNHYVSAVASCEERGKHFGKTHYQAILDMAEKDRRKGK